MSGQNDFVRFVRFLSGFCPVRTFFRKDRTKRTKNPPPLGGGFVRVRIPAILSGLFLRKRKALEGASGGQRCRIRWCRRRFIRSVRLEDKILMRLWCRRRMRPCRPCRSRPLGRRGRRFGIVPGQGGTYQRDRRRTQGSSPARIAPAANRARIAAGETRQRLLGEAARLQRRPQPCRRCRRYQVCRQGFVSHGLRLRQFRRLGQGKCRRPRMRRRQGCPEGSERRVASGFSVLG